MACQVPIKTVIIEDAMSVGVDDDLSCDLFSHTFFGGNALNKNGSGNGK